MLDSAFAVRSMSVVKSFLATAVVVDDRAFLSDGEVIAIDAKPAILNAPGRQAGDEQRVALGRPSEPTPFTLQSSASVNETEVPVQPTTPSDDRAHTLNGKEVIDAFAKVGIVCSVIRPTEEELEQLTGTLRSLLPVADVVVLDWVLCGDQLGTRPTELIRQLVTESGKSGGRIRLVLVYTGEQDLQRIASELRNALADKNPAKDGDVYSVVLPGIKIAVYGKQRSPVPGEAVGRRLNAVDLPDTIIREFSFMTSGLLANAAMDSITAIRNNAYQLLSKFARELDPAFVTQSILICPEKASEQIVPLIAAEIQGILEDSQIEQSVDVVHLHEWLDDRSGDGKLISANHRVTDQDLQQGVAALIDNGVQAEAKQKLSKEHQTFSAAIITNSLPNRLTELLSISDEEKRGDIGLAVLMSLRTRYEGAVPQLTLGTIVSNTARIKDKDVEQYWLCVQPVCDSVRIEDARPFPLLPLIPVSSHGKSSIILNEVETLFLEAKLNPYLVSMRTFAATHDGQVFSKDDGGKRVYQDVDGTVYVWRGELKAAHAQRIANDASFALARVGLYESEWNRLKK
jgi:hypothetical protein